MVCLAAGPPRVRQGGGATGNPVRVRDCPAAVSGNDPRQTALGPLAFMELQNVQELTNFFERRVAAYQVGVTGDVAFSEDF